MINLLIKNARIVTVGSAQTPTPRRGPTGLRDLGIIENGYITVNTQQGTIAGVGPMEYLNDKGHGHATDGLDYGHLKIIDAQGAVITPGFVDCHTHACWAGERLDEFQAKLEGADYLSILKAGGGIMSTVRATRTASLEELTQLTIMHLKRMLVFGTTTAEVKSGYGLNTETELKMLAAIDAAAEALPQMTITKTALIAHAVDAEQPDFFERTINETLPAVARIFPGITIDAYCEDGAWPVAETRQLFEAAQALGCQLRIHTDQFNSLGATALALELGATSVDHLEATTPHDIDCIAKSTTTIPVALPISGFNVDDRYTPARALLDAGAPLAIATNYNPGSAPSPAMPFALALACRKLKLTPAEALVASTINAAHVLGLADKVGSIEVGKRADLLIWDETDERALAYEFATTPPATIIAAGKILSLVVKTK